MIDNSLSIRKLAWLGFGFATGIAINQFCNTKLQMVLTAVLVLIMLKLATGDRLMRLRAVFFTAAFAIGLLWSMAYTSNLNNKLDVMDGVTRTVTVVCQDRTRYGEYYTTVDAKVIAGFDESFNISLVGFGDSLPELKAGQIITAEMKFSRSDVRYGQEYLYNLGSDVLMSAYIKGEVTISDEVSLMNYPRRITNAIEDIVKEVFPDDVSHFMTALLTGIKDDYYADEQLSLNVSHAGLAHVIAVSGMHISFLVAAIVLIFGRKSTLMISVVAIILFTMMIGSSPSIIRASSMYLALILAQRTRKNYDPMTILFAVLIVLLAQNPYAIHSISLQLSFAAMLGIFLFARPMNDALVGKFIKAEYHRYFANFLRLMFGIISLSISACIMTSPIIIIYFDYLSVYGVLTNLLCYSVVSIIFCFGYVACGLYLIFPSIAILLASVLAVGARYIFLVCDVVAHLPFSVVYMKSTVYIMWIVTAYALFAMAYFLRGREPFRPIMPAALTIISFSIMTIMLTNSANNADGVITVVDVGQGQCILIRDETETVLIDCGSGATLESAGEIVASELLSTGTNDVDAIVLTHLHEDHAGDVCDLLRLMPVSAIIMADNLDDSDDMLEEIVTLAQQKGTEIIYIAEDMLLELGDINLEIYAPLGDGDENERGIIIRAQVEDFSAMITGDVSYAIEEELIASKNIEECDLLVLGHHGSANSTSLKFVKAINPKYVAISVGYNSYGHPTYSAMVNATAFGAQLYRTDLNGNISFYTGD